MTTSERTPVPTGDPNLRVERDAMGRAYWADTGKRITYDELVESGEHDDANVPLIKALIRNGLWIDRRGRESMVTWDGMLYWIMGESER